MKIGVLSDTHIGSPSSRLSRQMITRFKAEKVELIFHLGDIMHQCVLDKLARIAPVKAVAGNMDPPEIKAKLPKKRVETASGVRFGLVHGSGPHTRLGKRLLPTFDGDDIDVLLYGHSHEARNEQLADVLLFNPGAARAIQGASASYGILTVENGHVYGEIMRIG